MRWLGAFFAGGIAGVLAAVALLYFNPLSDQRAVVADTTTVLTYELGPESLSLTHGQQLGFDLQPRDVAALWEATIRRTMLGAFVLRDADGAAIGVASRAVKLSTRSNPLLRGVLTDDHWLVTIPGAGSLFVESNDNIWPLLRATAVDVNLLQRSWAQPRHFELTAGPRDSGAARVIGTTGRFAGITGAAVHAIDVASYARPSQLLYPVEGQLRLDLSLTESRTVTTP